MDTLIDDKIPLVIGVTGHRNLHPDEIPKIKEKIKEVFDFFRSNYPHTPLLLISPLAEGADRLVAQVAVEENIRFIVPFPLPESEYRRDFKPKECEEEFDELLAKATDHFELPVLNAGIEIKNSEARHIQYALVGAYIARHSHILIALWDGKEQDNIGGTYQVLQYRLTGNMKELPEKYLPSSNPLDIIDTGKVCHIKVSRAPDPRFPESTKLVDAAKIYILSPEHKTHQTDINLLLNKELTQIDQFNDEVEKYVAKHQTIEFNPIIKPEQAKNLEKPFQKIKRLYEVASALCIENHRVTDNAMRYIFLLGIAMVTFLEFYAHPPWLNVIESGHPTYLLVIYLILFFVAFKTFQYANQQAIHLKYLHYRALAEALRIQAFWLLGGLDDSLADFYSRKYREELNWIRSSLRALSLHNWVNKQNAKPIVQDEWIRSQLKYYTKEVKERHKKLKRIELTARWLFVAGLVMASMLVIISLFFKEFLHHNHALQSSLIIAIALLPAIGAALDGYAEKMGFEHDIKRYQPMIELYERADKEIENPDIKHTQRLLLELGKTALEENSEWLLLHRDRPLDLDV